MGRMDTGRQAVVHSFGAVALMFAQWLISVILVRLDGYESAGVFSLAMSISNVFSAIAFYNLRNYRVTDVKGEFTQSQYLTAALFAMLASAVIFAGYILNAGGYSGVERWSIAAYLLFNYCNCAAETLYAYVQVKGRLELNGYSNTIRGAVLFLGFLGGFLASRNMIVALLAMAASNALVVVFFDVPMYKRVTGERLKLCPREWRTVIELLRRCFPMMAAIFLPIIVTAIPRRTIQSKLGAGMLGYFSSIFTVTVLITTVAPTIVNAFLPKIAQLWNDHDRRKLMRAVGACYLGVALFAALACVASALLGRFALGLIFGKEILAYFPLLYLSIIVSGLYSMTMIGNGILTTMRAGRVEMAAIVIDFAITALFSGVAVARFGIYGGAYVLIAAHGLQMTVQLLFIGKYLRTLKQKE